MKPIEATDEALLGLGQHCHRHADELGAPAPPPPSGGDFQATSAAVAAIHAHADRAGELFAERLRIFGHMVQTVAREFTVTDSTAAQAITSVAATEATF